MTPKNKVQLITYPDSLGGNLKSLREVLDKRLSGVFKGGIHILPPFPSSGDRGFAPLTYLEIAPEFGTWEDIRAIGNDHDLVLDYMVNHISRQSEYFKDYLRRGSASEYADMFIPLSKIWPDGKPVQKDIDKMFLRRNTPYSRFAIEATGEEVDVWTTFGKQTPSEQIDIDVHSDISKGMTEKILTNFSEQGIRIIRLDAVGFVIKKLGTPCFFVEPEIYAYLDRIRKLADSLGLALLPEVHAKYETQYKLAEQGFWIYDFILPFMVLEALHTRNGAKLLQYIKTRPERAFTMLDCHDGIPIKPDLDGLVSTDDAKAFVDACMERGANLSLVFSGTHKNEDGFDVHQIRCSCYSALDCNDDAYLAARAIQFFVPGIPQVYYMGLLAGENDEASIQLSGEGRDINRRNYSLAEIDEALEKDVVKRLLKLIHFRNGHPAFDGTLAAEGNSPDSLCLSWKNGEHECRLQVDWRTYKAVITYSDDAQKELQYTV